ncbi:uncharacterized protein LOC109425546 [Aedes albopictus]|uniref:Secreted protein n=1 Tax=Aedes albopictus TaxID=7160 RepID=A0ABM2A166_AEDAL|nr:uncharacterized protein LOC109425546 [Aedes albopictus]
MSTHLRFRTSITFLLTLFTVANSVSDQGRYYAPWLIFPPTAPTRHQLISGIGIPLGTPESIVSGWVLKAQYFLPTSVNDLRPVYLEGWNDSRKSIAKRDTLAVVTPLQGYGASQNDEVPKEDDDLFDDSDDEYWSTLDEEQHVRETTRQSSTANEDLSTIPAGYDTNLSRWTTYKALEQIGAVYGAGGRECVLRSICEAASAVFTHTGGIFAELLHIVFTPSTTTESMSDNSDGEYYRAEQLGRDGAPCHLVFHECGISLLDIFTGVHDSETNALTVAHDKLMKRSV